MTKMLRKDLLARLTKISAALSNNNVIEIATHFCFTGKEVFAYDDRIGMSTALETEFVGAVPGKTLLQLLGSSGAKEVEMVPESKGSSTLIVRAASSRWKLGILPKERFIWEVQRPLSKAGKIKLTRLIEGVEVCLRSVAKDPEQNGVTMVSDGKTVTLYASDSETVSTAQFPFPNTFKQRVVLPEAFCKQLIAIGEEGSHLEINVQQETEGNTIRGWALATGSGVTLFGRLLNPSVPLDFEQIVEQYVPPDYEDNLVEIPEKLDAILNRATVIMDNSDENGSTNINIKPRGIASFHSQSRRGTVDDKMQIDNRQAEVSIKINPRHLKGGYDSDAKWLVTRDAVLIAKGDALYLIGRLI